MELISLFPYLTVPAVRNFAIYAAGAVLVNALLQVTIFMSAMAIDLRRIEVSPCPRERLVW